MCAWRFLCKGEPLQSSMTAYFEWLDNVVSWNWWCSLHGFISHRVKPSWLMDSLIGISTNLSGNTLRLEHLAFFTDFSSDSSHCPPKFIFSPFFAALQIEQTTNGRNCLHIPHARKFFYGRERKSLPPPLLFLCGHLRKKS